jgi:hypothetical protein
MFRTFVVALAFAGIASFAQAQDAVPTARNAAPLDTSGQAAPPPLDAPRPGEALREVVKIGPCTPHAEIIAEQAREDGAKIEPDHDAHGEVGAGIGTNGYREFHGVVCKPIGDNSTVTLSISNRDYGGRKH